MATKKKYSRETIRELGIFPRHFDDFTIGDAIRVSLRIKEGDKERLQVFEGDVIAIHNKGASSSFIVRKIAVNQVAVERIFPYYSPVIEAVTFVSKGRVRRAKLYYIRERIGKAARVKEKILTKEEKRLLAERVKRNRQVKQEEAVQAAERSAPEVVETGAEEKISE